MRVHPLDILGKVFTFGGFILLIWTSSTFTHAVIKEHYFHPSECILDKIEYKVDTCQLDLHHEFSTTFYPVQYTCWQLYITSPVYTNRSILLTQTRLRFTDKTCFVSFGNIAYNNYACNASGMDARVLKVVNHTLLALSGVEYDFDTELIKAHKTQYFYTNALFPCYIQVEPYQAILIKESELWHISLTFASLAVLFIGLALLRRWGDGIFKTFAICLSDEIFSYLVILPYYVVCLVVYLIFTCLHYLVYNAKPRMSMERFWLKGGLAVPFIKLYHLLKHSNPDTSPDTNPDTNPDTSPGEAEVTLPPSLTIPPEVPAQREDPPPKYEDLADVSPPPSYSDVMRTASNHPS